MSAHVLGDKDINASIEQQQQQSKDLKSMDYHRQVFQSKMAQEPYVPRKTASASSSRSATTTTSSRSSFRMEDLYYRNATIVTNLSDASSCSTTAASSYPSPVSLVSDDAFSSSSSSFSSSASPTPSITALPRFPTNKSLVASTKQYISPSDNIMSPCSAKINALRNKHVSK